MPNILARTAVGTSAVALCFIASSAMGADEVVALAPSGEWLVNGDEESCWISRRFGRDDGVSFSLQAFAPGRTNYYVILRGDALPHRDAGSLDLDYRFGPDSEFIPTTAVIGTNNGVPRVTFGTFLEPSDVVKAGREGEPTPAADMRAREAAIEELVLQFSRGRPLSLQLGSLAEPMARLHECAARLPEKWGLDFDTQRSLSHAPIPIEMGTWLGPGSYPWTYLRAARSLRIQVRLMTDDRGAVTHCAVQSPKGPNSAGEIACREIVKTARFEPALDHAGNPVASFHSTAIFFHTPRSNGPLRGNNRIQGL